MPTTRRPWPIVVTSFAALAAAATAYWTMRGGIGLTNDSQAYLRLADGIALRVAGDPVTDVLSRRFPPLFPAILAIGEAAAHVGLQRVARLANVACLIASTILVFAIARRARSGDDAPWRAALAGVLFATASDALNVHVNCFSEPTFNVWMLLGALAVDRYLSGGGRSRWLIATALLGAAAVLTRYAGVALVAAEAIVVLARSPCDRRATRVAHAGVVALVPMLAMFAWTHGGEPLTGVGVGQREFTLAVVPAARLDQCLAALGSWAAWYAPWPYVARAGGAVAVALLAWLIARPRRALFDPALALPWTYLCVYPLFLFVSITFVDPATPLDLRILSPLHAMATVVACATLGPRRPRVAIVAAIALLGLQFASTAYYAANVRQAGLGYASVRWRENQTIKLAATLPPDVPIFTTHHFALELMLGRDTFELPAWPTGASQPDASLDSLAAPMLAPVRAAGGRGYLVYLRRPKTTRPFLTPANLGRYFKLQRIADVADGRVFKILGVISDVPPTTTTTMPATRTRDDADDASGLPDVD